MLPGNTHTPQSTNIRACRGIQQPNLNHAITQSAERVVPYFRYTVTEGKARLTDACGARTGDANRGSG